MHTLPEWFTTAYKMARIAFLGVLFFCALAVCCPPAYADHSMQKPCVVCHTLRSANVVPCSRNVLKDQVLDALYNADWYCGAGWPSDCTKAQTEPLDCGYCHELDIGAEIKLGQITGGASAHPVDVLANGITIPAGKRILCNDCHNGPTSGTPKLTPESKCSKSETDGYPNHIDAIISTAINELPGWNRLDKNRPWLTYPYGPEPGTNPSTPTADWTKTTFVATDVLCFVCHDQTSTTKPPFTQDLNEAGMVNIMAEYNLTGGGHNVAGIGNGVGGVSNKKLPCYACHDPHSGVDPDSTSRVNHSLIIPIQKATGSDVVITNPYEPTATKDEQFTYAGFDPAVGGDRDLCLECHDSAKTTKVEGVRPVSLQHPIQSGNLKFGFHANAHANVIGSPSANCLQANGGCHQSPHNTSPFDCLGCHTNGATDFAKFPDNLKRVANVDSEYDGIGFVTGKGVKSQHNIAYNRSGSLSSTADNGCLSCHNVSGSVSGRKVALPDGTDFPPPAMDNRESLSAYNAFCTGCHDGSADTGESMSGLLAPRVERYFSKGGHGTGFTTGVHLESGNNDPKIPCLECHMYHGSTAYKLLPGNAQTTDWADQSPSDAGGRVVKGFDYTTLAETTATKFTIGGVSDSRAIDYVDYTISGANNNSRLADDNRRSWKYANYTNNPPWSTYYEATGNSTFPRDPAGDEIQYGTSGDIIDKTKLGCTDYAQNAVDKEIGFCYACHLYNNATDGTTDTFGKMIYTHEGVLPGQGTTCQSEEYCSTESFKKDCTECHDIHGSGAVSPENPNWFMIRGKITTGWQTTKDTYNVVFDDTEGNGIFTGIDSGDEQDTDNQDDICAVCHTQTTHNLRDSVTSHYQGNCFTCHPHGNNKKRPWIGFPGGDCVEACDGCHGFPPQRPADPVNPVAPPEENYPGGGGPHVEHVNFLAAKTGQPITFENVKSLCAPCHGEFAPYHWNIPGTAVWPSSIRADVAIGRRASSSWGGAAKYNDQLLPDPAVTPLVADDSAIGAFPPVGGNMSVDNSRCVTVDCHNDSTATKLAWYVTTAEPDPSGSVSGSLAQDAPLRTKICYDCHRAPGPDIRIYDKDGVQKYGKKGTSGVTTFYDPVKINAAANYYGTVSTYGRGGHGDVKIQSESPFINSDPGHTIATGAPIDCTACHDWQAAHFPVAAANMYRLRNTTVENSLHTSFGLCNECHSGSTYPGQSPAYHHHPSFIPLPSSSTYSNKYPIKKEVDGGTTWTNTSGIYAQSAYAPSNPTIFGPAGNKDVDYFTDWYNRGPTWPINPNENHNQTSPRPVFINENGAYNSTTSPKATLPLAEMIIGTDTGKIMCVTCHNPHGTDLFVFDPTGIGRDIADHNMLRLQDTDNTLCNACH